MSWGVCFGVILFRTLWVSWTWVTISFPILGKFSTIISSSVFSWPFFLSSSSWTPVIRILGCLTLSQRSLRLSSSFNSFFFFPLCLIYFLKSTIARGCSSNWLQRGWSRELLWWKICVLISEFMNHNFTFSNIKLYMAIIVIINVDVGTD